MTAETTSTIDRARAGDRAAFGELYAAYQPQVYAFVFHRTGDRHLAEDLTSDAFVRALSHIETFTWQGRDIGAWLTTIARNLITDHFKSARSQRETPVAEMRDWDTVPDPADDVADRLSRQDQAAAVHAALNMLTEPQRQCLTLRFWHELPFAEIARLMGRPRGAAKELQGRALRKLRTPAVREAALTGTTAQRGA